MTKRKMLVLVLLGTALLGYLGATSVGAQGRSPIDRVLEILTDPNFGLAEIKREIRAIEEKLTPPSGTSKLSSGLFGLPAGAASVDWMVVNDAATPQTFTVTVFKAGVGPKTVVVPGALTFTLAPGESTHNANNVDFSGPFVPGFYYEVVVETSSPNVLPSVHVWQDHVNTVIPGTLVPPGSWVRLQ
jgi:hypothetical protein